MERVFIVFVPEDDTYSFSGVRFELGNIFNVESSAQSEVDSINKRKPYDSYPNAYYEERGVL